MSLMGHYGAGPMSCCGGRGRHEYDCEDALEHQREAEGWRRCEGCGHWAREALCDECVAYAEQERQHQHTIARES